MKFNVQNYYVDIVTAIVVLVDFFGSEVSDLSLEKIFVNKKGLLYS